ncbi:MAG: hypothetical protein ACI9YO_002941 [Gammaproteobacteria bacterium]|jgi:uncharacterized protein YyaL (SSP411 family)
MLDRLVYKPIIFHSRNKTMKRNRSVAAIILSFFIFSSANSEEHVSEHSTLSFSPRTEILQKSIDHALSAMGANYNARTEHLDSNGHPKYTNRLILEDSPYLIQHAHNPVDWYAWGPEAFETAQRENKPIFLSIGYSTCHWCHVMERESFENPAIAQILNQYFISIKVDRERRPDIDKTYMQAIQLIAGNGGWPMSSFLTSDGKPFFGGTYYPPAAFADLTLRVANAWADQREQLVAQGERLSVAIAQMTNNERAAGQLSEQAAKNAVIEALYTHDELQGGFGYAPKFPQEPLLFLLLDEAERHQDKVALDAVETTLDAMGRGGIYDQIGGGFHRYSTDSEWLVPHFEKMLYNQAHLSRVFLQAWRLTGNPGYRRIATQTFDYILRDMTNPDGGFYSATDADSEGEEGTFFLWSSDQISASLSEQDATFAMNLFGVSDEGNFEQSNILHLPVPLKQVAKREGISVDELSIRLDRIRETLYQAREKRVHPLRDEKILTAWNGMMITSLAQAGVLLDEPRYTNAAVRAAQFIWQHNRKNLGELKRVHLNGSSSIDAQQEDYAYFAEGLIHLYDVTNEQHWLDKAIEMTNSMLTNFRDKTVGGFFMTPEKNQLTSMARQKDGGVDAAIPSGNSVALHVLQMLDRRKANFEYSKHANATLAAFANTINQRPTNFGYMLMAANNFKHGELGAKQYIARGGVQLKASQVSSSKIIIELIIPEGWHVNSNQPRQKGLIATSVSFAGPDSEWDIKKVKYPKPNIANLGFQTESLSLYQGKVRIEIEFGEGDSPRHLLPLQLDIQACNDKICLPPEVVQLGVPLSLEATSNP